MLRIPVNYAGGKYFMTSILIKYLPYHTNYVEVFGGGGSLLFAKRPCSGVETYNDIDGDLVNLFRVLRDIKKVKKLQELLELTPFSREEFFFCRDKTHTDDDVERARRYYAKCRMSFSGKGDTWSFAIDKKAVSLLAYINNIPHLGEFYKRLRKVQIENYDFRKLIPIHRTPGTLLYCDPPYVLEARKGELYSFEMTEQDHKDLVVLLLNHPAMVMISGYNHPIYTVLEMSGWTKREFEMTTIISNARTTEGKRKKRTEVLWHNKKAEDNLQQMSLFSKEE